MMTLTMVNTSTEHKREHGRARKGGVLTIWLQEYPFTHKQQALTPLRKKMEWSGSVCCHRNACCQGSNMCVRGEREHMDMHIYRWCGLCSSCPNKKKQACKGK